MPEDAHLAKLQYLQLSRASFEALVTGRLDTENIELLLGAERSRRLLLLQYVLTATRRTPSLLGPLGDVREAEALLDTVHEVQPEAWERLLLQPYTGMWLAHTVRVLNRGDGPVVGNPPWWHVGRLMSLAATAAIHAGIPFEIAVPSEGGSVILPSLGRVDLHQPPHPPAEHEDVAHVVSDGQSVTATLAGRSLHIASFTDAAPGWTPVPVIRAPGTYGSLEITLDAIDPIPGRIGLPAPTDLGAEERDAWKQRLLAAWRMLDADHAQEAAALATGLLTVSPFKGDGTATTAGSSAEGFGAASISLPETTAELACALIHEFRHSVLNGLLHLVELSRPDPQGTLYYAPWRDDPRPLLGLLHGGYAFTAVTQFWRIRTQCDGSADGRRAELEYAYWRRQTLLVLDQLMRNPWLTPLGARTVQLLRTQVVEWVDGLVTAEATRLARAAARCHHASWRVHHVAVDLEWARAATRAWFDRRPPPQPAFGDQILPDPTAHHLSRVFDLAVHHHADIGVSQACVEAARRADASGADQLVVEGDIAAARDRYLNVIATHPDDPHPWGGLGSAFAETLPETAPQPSAVRLLTSHPERVRAVYRRIRSTSREIPEVLELADWLTRPTCLTTKASGPNRS